MKLTLDSLQPHLAAQLLPVYLISGDEPLLAAEAADALRAAARARGFTERETHFIERGTGWDALAGAVSNRSLFAARRIIEVRMGSAKSGVAGAAALTRLAELCDPELLVVILAPRLGDASSASWVKAVEKHGASLSVWPIDEKHWIGWLEGRCRRLGIKADAGALALLAERTEGNLLAAQQELEKLALFSAGATVNIEAVLASVADSARFDVAQLGEAALAGDAARALHVLAGLRSEGVEPTFVLWALNKAVRDLWRTWQGASAGAAPSWQRTSPALARGLRRAGSVPFARLSVRAERADRMIKGRLGGEPWDEIALLAAEFSTRALLGLPRVSNRN